MSDVCVVTEPCLDCKYTDCVTVCPVDCFYQDERMLYIDPEECVCCGACIPQCPVGAIFYRGDVPTRWQDFIPLNAERSTVLKDNGGHLTTKQTPLLAPGCKKA